MAKRIQACCRRKILTGVDAGKGRAPTWKRNIKAEPRKKKEDQALQKLGEQLVALPPGQLGNMGLPDDLLEAIELAQKIKSHGARRRQIQYIGALMRHTDPQPIEAALHRIRAGN